MAKIQTMSELIAYLLCTNYPDEIQSATVHAMHKIEACNVGGGQDSCLLIANTQEDAAQIEEEYNLLDNVPESDVCITTVGGMVWRERVFVFGDDGNGVIYYERVPLLDENDTETERNGASQSRAHRCTRNTRNWGSSGARSGDLPVARPKIDEK